VNERGVVIGTGGPRFAVLAGGREILCSLRGRLKQRRQNVTTLAVIGDEVEIEAQADGSGAIEAVLPRRSELRRPGFAGRDRVVAANLDRLIVVQSALEPGFNRHLVERFLTIGTRGGIPGLVVVNKSDLVADSVLHEAVAPLRENGIEVLYTSARTGRGLPELAAAVRGRIAAMVGPSGVGKSSLLNALDPGLSIATKAVSGMNQRGRHTTSASRLYPLEGGGFLADTPGIRELALFEEDRESLDIVFPEITQLAVACRFRNCSHVHEPDCAVRSAVADGVIGEDRYRHYLRLQKGE
jgi:ribosome biogenesis GTPase